MFTQFQITSLHVDTLSLIWSRISLFLTWADLFCSLDSLVSFLPNIVDYGCQCQPTHLLLTLCLSAAAFSAVYEIMPGSQPLFTHSALNTYFQIFLEDGHAKIGVHESPTFDSTRHIGYLSWFPIQRSCLGCSAFSHKRTNLFGQINEVQSKVWWLGHWASKTEKTNIDVFLSINHGCIHL